MRRCHTGACPRYASQPRAPAPAGAMDPGDKPRDDDGLRLARSQTLVRAEARTPDLLDVVLQHLADVLALAGHGRDDRVGVGLVHRRPLGEVVGRVRDRLLVEHGVLQRGEVLVLGGELRPQLDVGRRTAGLLPHLDLAGLVAHHGGEHLLDELLPLRRHADRNGPAPDLVPGGRHLGARPDRERRHADLADDLGALGIAELAEVGGVDQRERGVAGHEDGVGLVAAVGRHAGRADLVRVDRVPPELDDLAMAGLGDGRLELGGLELLVVALEQGFEDVAVVGPHGPPEAEPGVVHRHAADITPLDLAFLLQALADRDELVEGLGHLLRLHQVAAVEERADGVRHGHGGELLVVVPEGEQRPLVGVLDAFDVVGRLEPLLPQLAPVVVVPDHVELVGARGQRGRDLLHEHAVGHGDARQLDVVGLGPLLHDVEGGVLDRVLHVPDLDLALLGERGGGSAGRDADGERDCRGGILSSRGR